MDHTDHPHHSPGRFTTSKKFVSTTIAVILLSGGFYWYQLRPSSIRSTCAIESSARAFVTEANKDDAKGIERLRMQNESFETYYLLCVRSKGLAS